MRGAGGVRGAANPSAEGKSVRGAKRGRGVGKRERGRGEYLKQSLTLPLMSESQVLLHSLLSLACVRCSFTKSIAS